MAAVCSGAQCAWTPHDDDVGEHSATTPTPAEFYQRALDVRAASFRVATASGEHGVACAQSRHAELPDTCVVFVVLGSDCSRFAYTGQYIVDVSHSSHVRILRGWSQYQVEDGICPQEDEDTEECARTRPAPMSRIVFEMFGRPLHLASAIAYAVGGRSDTQCTMAPLLRLGCLSCGCVLLRAVAEREVYERGGNEVDQIGGMLESMRV